MGAGPAINAISTNLFSILHRNISLSLGNINYAHNSKKGNNNNHAQKLNLRNISQNISGSSAQNGNHSKRLHGGHRHSKPTSPHIYLLPSRFFFLHFF